MTTEIIASDASFTFDEHDMHTLLSMVAANEASNDDASQASSEQRSLSKLERERARARAKTKRFYHRRANMLRSLREEVVELEGKLQELDAPPQTKDVEQRHSLELTGSLHSGDSLDRESLERLVRNLALARARLKEENAALRTLYQQSSHTFQHIRDLMFSVDDKLFVADRSSFALLRPLTLEDCLKIRQRALYEFRTFAANEHYVKPQGSMYGWKMRRIVEHDAIKFAMTKTIYHHTAESIFQRTWKILSDPAGIAMYYANALDFKCNVVQKVDDNNFVWYLESRLVSPESTDGGKPVIVKSVLLISRFLTRNGQFILVRGLGSDHFEVFDTPAKGVMEVWTDILAWIQSSPTGTNGEHCQSSYAGITPTGGADPKFWLTEIALHVLRWEAAALGTRFSLPSSESHGLEQTLRMEDRCLFELLRPLNMTDCLEIRQRALYEFRTFAANEHYVKPQGSMYGWKMRRIVEHDAIKFAMTKTIYHHTAESIFQRTWRMLTDPAGMTKLYSNSIHFKCHIVQKVDENNFVWYLESRQDAPVGADGATPVIVKSVVLISRFLTRNGQFILIRGLSSDHFEIFDTSADGATEVWTDMLAWIQSSPTGANGEHCQSSYAGITPTGGADPKFWLAEIALHVLRWEAAALGTRFSLPSE